MQESSGRVIPFRALHNGGEPPDNDAMEARVAKLEALAAKMEDRMSSVDVRLARIEGKQDEFNKHFATKADVMAAKNSIIMWVVSAVLLAQLLPALLKKFGL